MPIGTDPIFSRIQQYIPFFLKQLEEGDQTDPFAGLVGDVEKQFGQANTEAQSAFQAIQEAMGAPRQTTSPGLDFGATLLGGISQALAPQQQGAAAARAGLESKQEDFDKLRDERLKNLESHYTELAGRARQLKNTELAVKMEQKAENARKTRDKNSEALKMATSVAVGGEEIQSREKVARIGADARLDVATRNAQAKYGLKYNPATNDWETPPNAVSEDDFNRGILEPSKALMTSKGKERDVALSLFKGRFSSRKENEVANPSLYVLRLVTANPKSNNKIKLPFFSKAKDNPIESIYTPMEIAKYTAINYDKDLNTPEGLKFVRDALVRAGLPIQLAEDAVIKAQ